MTFNLEITECCIVFGIVCILTVHHLLESESLTLLAEDQNEYHWPFYPQPLLKIVATNLTTGASDTSSSSTAVGAATATSSHQEAINNVQITRISAKQ